MRLVDDLTRHLASGPGVGVVGAIGLDRPTGLPGPLVSTAAQRLFLRTAGIDDAALVTVPTSAARRRMLAQAPPGRGVATPDGLPIQVALPAPDGPAT
jgi:hypothetical protein